MSDTTVIIGDITLIIGDVLSDKHLLHINTDKKLHDIISELNEKYTAYESKDYLVLATLQEMYGWDNLDLYDAATDASRADVIEYLNWKGTSFTPEMKKVVKSVVNKYTETAKGVNEIDRPLISATQSMASVGCQPNFHF